MASRVAVVTGANKGIGFEIVRGLLKLGEPGLRVVLCSRDLARGTESLLKLRKEFPEKATLLTTEQVEISSEKSVADFAKVLSEKYKRLDILIHNAAIGPSDPDLSLAEQLKQVSDINYYGTLNANTSLLPLVLQTHRQFKTEPKIIILASQLATSYYNALSKQEQEIWKKINSLKSLETQFKTSGETLLKSKKDQSEFSQAAYSITKVGVIVYAKLLAAEVKDQVFVASMCPGYCDTDMTKHLGPRTAEKGAETAVWLSLLNKGEVPTGKFWYDKEDISFL